MKPGAGKLKGNSFERHISRILTKWVTGSEHPEIFWPTSASGAKATQDHKVGRQSKMYGDIMAIDDVGTWFTDHILIECKSYKTFDIAKLLLDKGEILGWWNQACEGAGKAEKIPILVFKKNHFPILVAMRNLSLFEEDLIGNYRNSYIQAQDSKKYVLFICLFEEWLEFLDPKILKVVWR